MIGIIKIDVPEDCGCCQLAEYEEDWLGMLCRAECKPTGKRVEVYCGTERPPFCPIEVEDVHI